MAASWWMNNNLEKEVGGVRVKMLQGRERGKDGQEVDRLEAGLEVTAMIFKAESGVLKVGKGCISGDFVGERSIFLQLVVEIT